MSTRWVVFGLLLAVIAAAVAVVESKHRSRALFVELQSLERERDRLNVEWGRLRLEQGAWATHGRVEDLARTELDMRMPRAAGTIIVRAGEGAASRGVAGEAVALGAE